MWLQTFGKLMVRGVNFRRQKPLLLLVYLALEGRKPRRYLADLFYMDARNPLNNLSRALTHLRSVSPDLIDADNLSVWPNIVSCDAVDLQTLLNRSRSEEALQLYQGAFLADLDLPLSSELEDWVLSTREFLGARVREALLRQAEAHVALANYQQAAAYAEQAYDLPGAGEVELENFERMYLLLSAGHSPKAASIRKEASSIGIDLHYSSDEARERLHANTPTVTQRLTYLPERSTSFVGRQQELKDIIAQLEQPNCRLLSLLGAGGTGKTRLALHAANHLSRSPHFQDGVIFIPLETLRNPEQLPVVIAASLGLELSGVSDALAQLCKFVGEKAFLLVLDNFEQLMDGVTVLPQLLEACSNITLLVTSRERLNIAEEWAHFLTGLPVPPEDASPEVGRQYDAVVLFEHRAKRSRLNFELTDETVPYVMKICRLLEGSPLAIELAAAWVRVMPPEHILAEMMRGTELLSSAAHDVSERHRSMHAVFEASWELLTPVEQCTLRRLAVFQAGFRKRAAAEVVGATIPIIASLLDKSLLRASALGRYDRHALLHRFTEEKLAQHEQEKAECEQRHSHYFLEFVARMEPRFLGSDSKEAMNAVEEELENLRAAWTYACTHHAYHDIEAASIALRVFFDKRGRFAQGREYFTQAQTALESGAHHGDNAQRLAALGAVRIALAWLDYRLGEREVALEEVSDGLDIVRRLGEKKQVAEGLHVLGALSLNKGVAMHARQHWQEALSILEGLKDALGIARTLNYLAIAEEFLDNYQQAEHYYLRALDVSRRLDDRMNTVTLLNNFATFLLTIESFDEAQPVLEEGLELAQSLAITQDVPYLLNNLARVACAQARFEDAWRLSHEALSRARDMGERLLEAKVLIETQGRIALAEHQSGRARHLFVRGLAIARDLDAVVLVIMALQGLAEVMMDTGHPEEAVTLLGLLLQHTATPKSVRKAVNALLFELQVRLGEDRVRYYLQEATTASLERHVTQFIGV